jgi:hypothetical protein
MLDWSHVWPDQSKNKKRISQYDRLFNDLDWEN